MEKNDDGLMVPLDLPCCIFDENKLEENQCLLDMVNAFAKPESDKSLPKFNADECHQFKMYLKRIIILNKDLVSHNKFYKIQASSIQYSSNFEEVN